MTNENLNGLLIEKVQSVKNNASSLAMSPPLNVIREVLVILKSKGMSVAKIADFLKNQNFMYSRGQIRYYLMKNPITRHELSTIEL